MGNMKPGQIEARLRWFLSGKKMRRNPKMNHGFWLHQRGYHLGDIRCTKCLKWIHPDNPEEAKEIKIGAIGKRTHNQRYCLSNGKGSAAFITAPRHSPSRRKKVLEAKRY